MDYYCSKYASMKKISFLFLLAFSATHVFAQQQTAKSPSADAAFADALNKVIQDFTSNFIHIQGDKMPADVDADTYKDRKSVV